MSSRRGWRRQRTDLRRRAGAFQLRIEPLEARRLLAGIQVSVYIDQDNSRGFEPTTDAAAPNRLVYVDLDANGAHDPGEPLAITDEAGNAFFEGLELGDYSIGLITNANTQPQTAPTIVAAPIAFSDVEVNRVWASEDLSVAWSIDRDGNAVPLSGAADLPAAVPLGKLIVTTQNQDQIYAIADGELTREFVEFNLRTGAVSRLPLIGQAADMEFKSIVRTGSQTVALLNSSAGNMLAHLTPATNRVTLSDPIFTPSYAIAASAASPLIASLSSTAGGQTKLAMLDPRAGYSESTSFLFDDHATAVKQSGNGKLAYVSLSAGGVLAIAVSPNALSLAAILHEAIGDVAGGAEDDRIVTGSSRSPRELITWDTTSWQPIGRTKLPTGSHPFTLPTIAVDRYGDNLLALAGNRLTTVDLAAAAPIRTSLTEAGQVGVVQFGVRTQGTSSLPEVSGTVAQTVDEDGSARFVLADLVSDPEAGVLWFTLEVPAQHGSLQATDDGAWLYTPDENFNGEDTATFAIYDGQQTSELRLHWQVSSVNDPPTSIEVGDFRLREDSEAGTELGPVSVVDPDLDGSYLITTSDDRFEVIDGFLYFVDGSLDFETEPTIPITITAEDFYDASIVISATATITIVDVNEQPFSMRLSGNSVAENEPGAVIGTLRIIDQDAASEYQFFVFDSRFVIEDRRLKLAEGVALDFESEPTIDLVVAATDGIFEISETFTISVIDRPEGAASLQLSNNTLEELTDGAVVGQLTVVNPQAQAYFFTVADPRFEVVGSVLKLRDDQQVSARSEPSLELAATAHADSGEQVSGVFTITLQAALSPFHNQANPADVNGDGEVSAIDVLLVINDLNANGNHPLPSGGTGTGEPPTEMLDVNNDGQISPIDVLLIINEINGVLDEQHTANTGLVNRSALQGEGEEVAAMGSVTSVDGEAERRRRENSNIDAELEVLLDQLSRARI